MAKNKKLDSEYYTKLIIHKSRRSALYILMSALFLALTFFIFNFNLKGINWTALIPIVFAAASLLVAFPMTEQWEYRPWQSKAIQYEKHHKG